MDRNQTKLCLLALIAPCSALRLRDTAAGNLGPASFEATEALHSAQFVFGIVALLLLCISFVLSFLFVGNVCERNKLLRVRIHSVKIDNLEAEPMTVVGLTAVIKMNTETAKNFVLPVQIQELTQASDPSVPACIFEFDANKVGQISFSFIVRDGNIPIHFETVNGTQFVKGAQPDIGPMRVLEFSTFHENELKLQNKRILLNYDLETK